MTSPSSGLLDVLGSTAIYTTSAHHNTSGLFLRELSRLKEFAWIISTSKPNPNGESSEDGAHRNSVGRRLVMCASVDTMVDQTTLVVCEGDETGQELLEQALRVLDATVLGVPIELQRFDLSLENRRQTNNGVVSEAAEAMLAVGLGLKAATITPPEVGDVGSPNRILREGVGGSVIVRTGRRIPGVVPLAPVVHPIVVVRMAVGDAYGAEEKRTGTPGTKDEQAWRTERIDRGHAEWWLSTRFGPQPPWMHASMEVRSGRFRHST